MKLLLPVLLILTAPAAVLAVAPALPDKIEFNRDVRPILSENCFKCHGFDQKKREANRRLDTRDGALADLEGIRAIVPGQLAASDAHVRIHSADKDEQMPPPKSRKVLTPRQIAILDRWIEQGAEYQPHWSYIAPQRPAVPQLEDAAFVRNPVDALVLARQRELGLQHAPEAARTTLIRRLSLDLAGLPPAPGEVDAFVNDAAPDAYERVVDRLLAAPEFGERMALGWLDVVRYADSIGFHSDNARNVSPYRDYVIRAFNENKPFNEFTIEQLAGDLLPGSTMWQKVASAYNRLNLTTEEGGAQAKDYEARTVADRVRAVGTVWLGQTTGCAQCHDHKYDPITARDFYRLGAFFADINEPSIGSRGEGMLVALPEQEAQLKQLDTRAAELKTQLEAATPELAAAQVEWEKQSSEAVSWTPLHPEKLEAEHGAALTIDAGEIIRTETKNAAGGEVFQLTVKTELQGITGFRIEALKSSRLPAQGPGRAGNGNFVLSEFFATARDGGDATRPLRFSGAAADFTQSGFSAAAAIDGVIGDRANGWAIYGQTGADHAIYFQLAEPLAGGSTSLVFTIRHDYGEDHVLGKFRLSTTTSPKPLNAAPGIPEPLVVSLKLPVDQRTEAQRAEIAKYFRSITPLLAELRGKLSEIEQQRKALSDTLPKCLVSEAMPNPRTVRILPRGDWQNETGPVVEPGVPEFLALTRIEGRRQTRLDLAQWVVARANPLTARVFVNRIWKLYFGTGLSKVLDDVGAQGEPPLNPALLDWLACEFMEPSVAGSPGLHTWDVKHLVRLIVTSGTYRQNSTAPKELLQRDPDNRELARQSRFRLDAEIVRDNALAIAGLLVRKIGGPSVKPYQPGGYWENLNFPTREWEPDKGENQWRRGLYTWWQRSYLHPSLVAFDAPSREECVAERVRSNIPQQALTLLNDPTYVEAARVFGARIMKEGGREPAQRIAWAYRQALGRAPRADELETLTTLAGKHTAAFSASTEAGAQVVKVGFAPVPNDAPAAELAAWMSVARVILNLHETITRN